MEKIKKLIQIVEVVSPGNIYILGLVAIKTKKKIAWEKLIKNQAVVVIDKDSDYLDILKQIKMSMEKGLWIILEIKDALPSQVYGGLRQLSQNNHLQINDGGEIVEVLQTDDTRIIVTGSKNMIDQVRSDYHEFINLFGPVVTI